MTAYGSRERGVESSSSQERHSSHDSYTDEEEEEERSIVEVPTPIPRGQPPRQKSTSPAATVSKGPIARRRVPQRAPPAAMKRVSVQTVSTPRPSNQTQRVRSERVYSSSSEGLTDDDNSRCDELDSQDESDVASTATVLTALAGAALAMPAKKNNSKTLSLGLAVAVVLVVLYVSYRIWCRISGLQVQIEKLKCQIESETLPSLTDSDVASIARKEADSVMSTEKIKSELASQDELLDRLELNRKRMMDHRPSKGPSLQTQGPCPKTQGPPLQTQGPPLQTQAPPPETQAPPPETQQSNQWQWQTQQPAQQQQHEVSASSLQQVIIYDDEENDDDAEQEKETQSPLIMNTEREALDDIDEDPRSPDAAQLSSSSIAVATEQPRESAKSASAVIEQEVATARSEEEPGAA